MRDDVGARHVLEEEPLNAETPLVALSGQTTPTDLCYVRTHFGVPVLDRDSHRVAVGGAVSDPVDLTVDDLRQLPERSVTMTLECAGNGRRRMSPRPSGTPWLYGGVSSVRFTGTPLRHVLDRVGLEDGVEEIGFVGADEGQVGSGETVPFARSLPLDTALEPEVLLAWRMNGRPLPPEHGAPLRVVVPGWYAMASVKWLRRIEALREPFEGWFQSDRYVYRGEDGTPDETPVREIRVRSLVTSPPEGEVLGRGTLEVTGFAWSDGTPVARVQVSVDGGDSWEDASLEEGASRWAPTRWRLSWRPPAAGDYELVSRAVDAEGEAQPLTSRWNRLGYGNNAAQRVRVSVR